MVISTQNWLILGKYFAKKIPMKSAVFYGLFLGEVCPRNFPWNQPIFFSKNPSKFGFFPLKSLETSQFFHKFWLFPSTIPWNRPIFLRILTFCPMKIPWNWPISANFSANLPLKIPRNLTVFPRPNFKFYWNPWYWGFKG